MRLHLQLHQIKHEIMITIKSDEEIKQRLDEPTYKSIIQLM